MKAVVFAITVPIPIPFNRDKEEWTTAHHQILFERMPTKQEFLFFLHQKGDESYRRSGNENNLWWDIIEVLRSFPNEKWIDTEEEVGANFYSANRPFTHPIMGDSSILWERKTVEPLDS